MRCPPSMVRTEAEMYPAALLPSKRRGPAISSFRPARPAYESQVSLDIPEYWTLTR
jgi:hypothetical protein